MALNQPGVTIRPITQLTGTAEFNEVYFDEAVCGPDDLVGAPGDGWKVAMGLLGFERGVSTLGQQMLFQTEGNSGTSIRLLSGLMAPRAGLSLARKLSAQISLGDIKAPVSLHGPLSPAATDSHIWGFWQTDWLSEPASLSKQSWKSWQIITQQGRVTQTSQSHPYHALGRIIEP